MLKPTQQNQVFFRKANKNRCGTTRPIFPPPPPPPYTMRLQRCGKSSSSPLFRITFPRWKTVRRGSSHSPQQQNGKQNLSGEFVSFESRGSVHQCTINVPFPAHYPHIPPLLDNRHIVLLFLSQRDCQPSNTVRRITKAVNQDSRCTGRVVESECRASFFPVAPTAGPLLSKGRRR